MGKPVLYINACVRKESRTERLAEKLLGKLDQPYEEVKLCELDFPCVDEAYIDQRNEFISRGEFDHPMFEPARRFAEAETIVIAAPFWDLSFPAMLKQYLEIVNVVGITFRYAEDGTLIGMCKAKKLYYVTTAGGYFVPEDYGFGYVKAFAESYYGIPDVRKFEAVGLDIVGADVEAIMIEAENKIIEEVI